jgi:acyl-CoA reductase-like NAD-dependent aldehyde dehydrogenase
MGDVVDIASEIIDTKWRPGDPLDSKTALGPLVSERQQDRVRGYIRGGIDAGAELIVGGPEPPRGLESGYYIAPTLFATADNGIAIAREEIFGPVLCLIPYDDDDQHAVDLANDSPYGLGGSVWSGSTERAERVARQLRTGSVEINGAALDGRAPYGGVKLSGYGREGGRVGIEEFLTWKVLNR